MLSSDMYVCFFTSAYSQWGLFRSPLFERNITLMCTNIEGLHMPFTHERAVIILKASHGMLKGYSHFVNGCHYRPPLFYPKAATLILIQY
jgi:hypothetical protein